MDEQTRMIIRRREEMLGRLKKLLIEHLHLALVPDEIDPDAALFGSGLDLDSIDAVEITVLLENAFGVRLRNIARKKSFRTLNTLADALFAGQAS